MDATGQTYFGLEGEIPTADKLRLEREQAKLQEAIRAMGEDDERTLGVAGSE